MRQASGFNLTFRGNSVQVTEHTIGKQQVFRVGFPDNRPPLIVVRAKGMDIGAFWTSIPEGRQEDADLIGELIEEYIKNLK